MPIQMQAVEEADARQEPAAEQRAGDGQRQAEGVGDQGDLGERHAAVDPEGLGHPGDRLVAELEEQGEEDDRQHLLAQQPGEERAHQLARRVRCSPCAGERPVAVLEEERADREERRRGRLRPPRRPASRCDRRPAARAPPVAITATRKAEARMPLISPRSRPVAASTAQASMAMSWVAEASVKVSRKAIISGPTFSAGSSGMTKADRRQRAEAGDDPGPARPEAVDERRPQRLPRPGQRQQAHQPDLFQRDAVGTEVDRPDLVHHAVGQPLRGVEHRDPGELAAAFFHPRILARHPAS